jgi:hypothetical protein
VKGKKLQ